MAHTEQYRLGLHGSIYAYLPDNLASINRQLPLVLDMNCTTGNPQAEVMTNGWQRLIDQKQIIVVAPTYNDYAMYSNCPYMKRVIDDAIKRYPVDQQKIYAVGFSNGGALAGALASTYPHLLAGIAAMGWMVGLNNRQITIPFMLIQGTNEYTQTVNGQSLVMNDERVALRDLFSANQLTGRDVDYQRTPYFGYVPDDQFIRKPRYFDYDPYGNHQHLQDDKIWQFNQYFKKGFRSPFALLVLVQDAPHIPHDYNATVA